MKKFFSFFAALLFAGSMMADQTITFKAGEGTSDSSSKVSTVEAIVAEGADLVASVEAENVYNARAGRGIKLGTSSKIGALTLNLASPIEANALVVTALMYNDSEKAFTIQGQEFTAADGDEFTEFTFTYETATEISSIALASPKRIYFTSVTIVTDGEVTPPEPEQEYYLVGSVRGWEPKAENKLAKNPGQEGEWFIEITCEANEGLKVLGVKGETQTWYQDGMGNEYVVTEAGDYTLYFRPEGNSEWGYTYFTLVAVEPLAPISCAEVYNLQKNDEVALNDVVVTYVNGKNVWVKDETASMLLFLSAEATWKAGDILSGVEGVVDIYKDLYEVKPNADQVAAVVVTEGEAPAPEEPETITAANMNAYVLLKEVELEGVFEEGQNGSIALSEDLVLFNKFKQAFTFEAGKAYNILGVVGIYNGALQVNFISAEEAGEPEIVELDVDYVDAMHIAAYNAWQFNFYKDWSSEEGVTYPDLYIGVYQKAEDKIAGTYTLEDLLFVQLFTSENDSAAAVQVTDFEVELLSEGVYHFEFAFVGDDGVTYVLDAELEPEAYEYGTWEDIELKDGEQGVEETVVVNSAVKTLNNGMLYIEKNGIRYSVLGQQIR